MQQAAGEMFKDKNFMVLVAQLRGLKIRKFIETVGEIMYNSTCVRTGA
jgi:hypothetical protein